eukprot:g1798.t1
MGGTVKPPCSNCKDKPDESPDDDFAHALDDAELLFARGQKDLMGEVGCEKYFKVRNIAGREVFWKSNSSRFVTAVKCVRISIPRAQEHALILRAFQIRSSKAGYNNAGFNLPSTLESKWSFPRTPLQTYNALNSEQAAMWQEHHLEWVLLMSVALALGEEGDSQLPYFAAGLLVALAGVGAIMLGGDSDESVDDKKVVKEYFNNAGFERWQKIYGETDDVNPVQKDIRVGHAETVQGSDISSAMVGEAEVRAQASLPAEKQPKFSTSDLEAISGKFDTVCCVDVLIHYPPDKMSGMVQHLAGLSKERLILSFAPKTWYYTLLKRIGELFPGKSKTTRAYLHEEVDVEAALQAAGYKVTRKEMTATNFYFSRLFEAQPERGVFPGFAEGVIADGKSIFLNLRGFTDKNKKHKMSERTLFRGYSMMKPITATAFMSLVDDGMFKLDDPVEKYIPAFKMLRVKRGKGTEPMRETMTLRHLLMHTSGIGYGPGAITPGVPLEKLYKTIATKQERGEIDTLEKLCNELCSLPLLFQPGSDYAYGMSLDVLGHVMQLATGKPLRRIIQSRVLEPVGMRDSCFLVPASKLHQLATYYRLMRDPVKGKRWLQRLDGSKARDSMYAKGSRAVYRSLGVPTGVPAGGGLWGAGRSTMLFSLRDILLYCQMLLNSGRSVSGRRVLKESTVRSLQTDWLRLKRASKIRDPPGWEGGIRCPHQMHPHQVDRPPDMTDFLLNFSKLCKASVDRTLEEVEKVGTMLEDEINDALQAEKNLYTLLFQTPVDLILSLPSPHGRRAPVQARTSIGQSLEQLREAAAKVPPRQPARMSMPDDWIYKQPAATQTSPRRLRRSRSDESSSSSLESEDEEQDEEDHAGKGLRTI